MRPRTKLDLARKALANPDMVTVLAISSIFNLGTEAVLGTRDETTGAPLFTPRRVERYTRLLLAAGLMEYDVDRPGVAVVSLLGARAMDALWPSWRRGEIQA